MTQRIHFDATEPGAAISVPLCGELGARVTASPEAVTCKRCRKRLAKLSQRSPDAAERYLEQVQAGQRDEPWDDVEGLPVLTPSTYKRIECACGDCSTCRFFMRIRQDEYAAPWRKTHVIHRPGRARWPSVTAALETYVSIRMDGYSSGGWGHSLDLIRTLGVRVQSDGAPVMRAELAADDAAEVERALVRAFNEHNDRGLGQQRAIAVLLARVVGRVEAVEGRGGQVAHRYVPVPAEELADRLSVSVAVIAGVVRAGRQQVYEQLRARGLVEEARRKSRAA